MHELFKKILSKAKPIENEDEKKAKMSVLDTLKESMGEEQKGKLKGLQKVSVIASDKKGIEEGLDKAKDIVKEIPNKEEIADNDESEEAEESEEVSPEHKKSVKEMFDNLSEEELEELKKFIASK